MTNLRDPVRATRRRATVVAFPLIAGLVAASPSAAGPPDLTDTIRRAVKADDLGRSKAVGNTRNLPTFEQVSADGGVLVGFEFALSSFAGRPTVCALKPIFRSPSGDKVGSAAGPFTEKGPPGGG
jgi:hypothetical protein